MSDAAAREQDDTEAGPAGSGLRVPFSDSETAPAPATRRRLARLIAAKLTLDLLFVVALAAYTHAVTFRASFKGEVEQADSRVVRGWVSDDSYPGAPVEVQLFVDGQFVVAAVADEPRPDAVGNARRGFVFEFGRERYGEHEARVYAVRAERGGARRTLRQIGEPVWLGRK